MATLATFALGLLFMAWGYYRIKTDFAKNKGRNNLLQLIFTGEASGIGQFLSGVVFMIISVITLFVK